ncbi:MAG: oligosaccharide flippase family protein [Candidatus Eisenbacteria bacterium]|nr:oligosaccharide flippase family protein [Candidatus Eisenbacteria bacterium]
MMRDSGIESHAKTVFRHSLMTLGTRVGIVLVNIPTSILVARLLGTEGQGIYASAIVFPTVFASIGILGVDAAHTYLLSGRRATLGQINGQTLRLLAAFSAIITPAYLVFLRFYEGASEPALVAVLTLAAAAIPVLLAKYFAVALLLGLHRIKWFNLGNTLQAILLLGLMCLNLFVFDGGPRGAIVAYLLSELAIVVLALVVARREAAGRPLLESPPPGLLRRSLVYGIQGHAGNVLVQFTYRFDMFLVLSMVGLAAQGLYSISVILAEKLSHIPQSVQVVLFPKLSSLPPEEANRLTPRVLRNSLFLTFLSGIALYLLSRPLLLLFYGTEYLPALQAFQILLPGIIVLSIAKILAGDLSSRDKRLYHTIASGAGFAANLGLCFAWIPRYGIEGAAWASTVAYSIQSAFMLWFFMRFSGSSLSESLFVRGEDFRTYGELLRTLLRRRG